MIKSVSSEAIKKLYGELGLPSENYIDDYKNDYLTINTARNGRDVLWYIDEVGEAAMYLDDLSFLSDDEIENQLC